MDKNKFNNQLNNQQFDPYNQPFGCGGQRIPIDISNIKKQLLENDQLNTHNNISLLKEKDDKILSLREEISLLKEQLTISNQLNELYKKIVNLLENNKNEI